MLGAQGVPEIRPNTAQVVACLTDHARENLNPGSILVTVLFEDDMKESTLAGVNPGPIIFVPVCCGSNIYLKQTNEAIMSSGRI